MTKFRHISPPLVVLLVSLIIYPTFAHKKPPPNDPNQTPPRGLEEIDPSKQKDQQPPYDPTEIDPSKQKDQQSLQNPEQIDPSKQKDQQPPQDPTEINSSKQKDRQLPRCLTEIDPSKQKDQRSPHDPTEIDPSKQKDQQPPYDPTEIDPSKQKDQQPSHDPEQIDPSKQKDQQPPQDPTEINPSKQKDQQLPRYLTEINPSKQKDQQPPQDPTGINPSKQKDQQPPQDPKQIDPSKQKDQQPPQDPTKIDPSKQKYQQPPQDPKQTSPPQDPKKTPPHNPKQTRPPIPKNHLPQNPKLSLPPIPDNHLPQNPKIKPPRDSIATPPQDEPQRPTPFHNRFKGHFSAVYAFGDSYTDTGNAQSMGSLTPSFSDSSSSPYGSNRLSDGRLVIDYITDSLGLPVLPPYQSTTANFTHGVNFAIAGATAVADDLLSKLARVFLLKGAPLSVMTQLDWYKKFQDERLCKGLDQKACADKLKTALFWVGEMGINDYSRAIGSKIPLPSIAKSSAAYTIELVRTLIQHGAKNIVVQGLPPVGCLPLDISVTPLTIRDKSGCSIIVNAAVTIHNQILQAKLEAYRKSSPDVTIIYADSWKAYYTIVNDPEKYQILETQKSCCGVTIKPEDMNFNIKSLCGSSGTTICGDPSQYISWDGIHPTESMNSHMTDQFINKGCCNPPFEELMKNRKNLL